MLTLSFVSCAPKDVKEVNGVEFNLSGMKTVYNLNDKLDVTGGKVVKMYNDGTSEELNLTTDMVTGFDSSKVGTSLVTIKCEKLSTTVTLTIKERVVNIYSTCGTLPTLYAGLNIMSDETESYVFFEREKTFGADEIFPEHVKMVLRGPNNAHIITIRDKIKEIEAQNPGTYFNLFCDDLRVQWEIQYFTMSKIAQENYSVTLISDGTATYTIAGKFNAESSIDAYKESEAAFTDKKAIALNGGDPDLDWHYAPMQLMDSCFSVSQNSNVRYWLQYSEVIVSEDALVAKEIAKMNIVKKEPNVMFSELNKDKKDLFFKLVNIDKAYFDGIFAKSPKPNMIISGSSEDSSGNFTGLIEKVVAQFGKEYDLFFKPHPSYPPTNGAIIDLDILTKHGIYVLPGQLPMEALMWVYPNMAIGGYKSSLYMSARSANVKFFLNLTNGTELPSPLNTMYAKYGWAKDAVFFAPIAVESVL